MYFGQILFHNDRFVSGEIEMTRIAALVLLALLLVLPARSVTADEVFEGVVIGAGTGAFLGGLATARADGILAGAIVGGTAGSIMGAQVERRRGYYWRHGDCFRKVAGTYRRVSRRFCY